MLRRSDAENGLQKRYEASPNDPVSRFSVSELPSCPPFWRCIISERALLFLLTVFSVNAGPVFALLFQEFFRFAGAFHAQPLAFASSSVHLGKRVELVHRAVSGAYHRQDQ